MQEEDKAKTFEWAVIELFGHQKIAGRVTEATIAGGSFVRVDVPDDKGRIKFTKFYGPTAIYAITPVDENVAVSTAQRCDQAPVHRFELPQLAAQQRPIGFDDEDEEEQ
jgi:hypothetical protein